MQLLYKRCSLAQRVYAAAILPKMPVLPNQTMSGHTQPVRTLDWPPPILEL